MTCYKCKKILTVHEPYIGLPHEPDDIILCHTCYMRAHIQTIVDAMGENIEHNLKKQILTVIGTSVGN